MGSASRSAANAWRWVSASPVPYAVSRTTLAKANLPTVGFPPSGSPHRRTPQGATPVTSRESSLLSLLEDIPCSRKGNRNTFLLPLFVRRQREDDEGVELAPATGQCTKGPLPPGTPRR